METELSKHVLVAICSVELRPIIYTKGDISAFEQEPILIKNWDDFLLKPVHYDKKGKLLTNPGSKFHK